MSQPAPPKQEPQSGVYRRILTDVPGSGRQHIADPLSKVDPKHLHVRTRIPTIFNMAVHSTLGKYLRKEKTYQNPQGEVFNMGTLSGLMDCFQFEYEALAPSLDGKGREEVTKVLQLAAIGNQEDSGLLANNILNEGAKNVAAKK